MAISRTLKTRGLKLLAAVAVILTLLGGVRLGNEITAPHAAPALHLLACGGDAVPPCD